MEVEQPVPTVESASEDEASFSCSEAENSDASVTTSIRKRRKRRRAPRNATNFLLAQAPPRIGTKKRILHLRPRLLLQLQQLSADRRPKPWIDVLPSSVVSGTLIASRLARRFPRMFRIKGELGLNDVILVKSEDYDARSSDNSEDDGDEDSLDKRELVAVISPLPRQEDSVEIVLADGSVWTASPMPTGSYEFTCVDDDGHKTTARWVKKTPKASPIESQASSVISPPSSDSTEYTFKFSLINPLSRRHPIMATLTPTNLEIFDNYTTISSSSGRYPPSRPFPAEVNGSGEVTPVLTSPTTDRTTAPVDEATKTLITVTSTWISLSHGLGWPTSASSRLPSAPTHVHALSTGDKSLTFPPQPESQMVPPSVAVKRQTVSPIQAFRADSVPAPARPKRAMSMGAAFLQRRRGRFAAEIEAAAPQVAEDDVEEVEGAELYEPGYLPGRSHGRFYRKLKALRDKFTGRR